MKRLSIVFAVALACQVGVAQAQKPDAEAAKYPKTEPRATSLGDLKPTTEMWFYEQAMRQYQDPKLAVRRNAEFRGQQRQQRLAAMQWYGLSNARPRASSDPIHTEYSPGWASNNVYYPYRWSGSCEPVIVVHSESGEYLR